MVIQVESGDPIKVVDVNINIYGEGILDYDYQDIIKNSKLLIGKTLNHNDYEQLKSKLYNLALFKGYFDAYFQKSQLIVQPSCYQSIWNIDFFTGPRYFYENIILKNSHINRKYLNNVINVRLGDYYNAESVMELNYRLYSTNWFESVLISSDLLQNQKKKLILNILFKPNVKNSFEIGSGYSTGSGLRIKASWKKPWVNVYGHSAENNFNISELEQYIDLNYKVPLFRNPLEEYYLFQGKLTHEETLCNIEFFSLSANIGRFWNYPNSWQRSVNLCWIYNNSTYNITANSKCTMLIYPGLSVSRVRKCGNITPFWGDSQRYSIHISNNFWGSNIDFVIFQAQNIWIRTWLKNHRILIRGNLNWIESNNNLPFFTSLLRLFPIRDQNIRGYRYKSSDVHMESINKLITSTIEYHYNVFNNWWFAVFLDVGEITNELKWRNFRSGTGVGIRWQLPIGPMRLDFALPLIKEGQTNRKFLCFYVNLGPEL